MRLVRLILPICLLSLSQGGLGAESRKLNLSLRPAEHSPYAGALVTGDPFQIESMRGAWVRVRQGRTLGWLKERALWRLAPSPAAEFRVRSLPALDLQLADPVEPGARQQGPSLPGSAEQPEEFRDPGLKGLLEFAMGNAERERKISHPYFRDRITEVSDEWGPLYYRTTQHFYVKGIFLHSFDRDRIRLGLFKRRIHYRRFMGDSWSDAFLESLLEGEQGWRSSRRLFGRGQEYYLELSLHF